MRARGTVRREVRIARTSADVWAIVGDPGRLAEWFPGIVSCTVDGTTRTVTTKSGIPLVEELVTVDPLLRRLQYRIGGGIVREHLSTLDVFDLGDGSSLVAYGVDADPSTMALVIGGAAGNALLYLRAMMQGGP